MCGEAVTALPEVPRYHVFAANLYRWDEVPSRDLVKAGYREVVRYADHLTAMQQQRVTALREALAAVEDEQIRWFDNPVKLNGLNAAIAVIQRLIDGPDVTPSEGGE